MPFTGLGAGTVESPYEVATAAQFAEVADYLSAYFIQTANITGITSGIAGNFSGSYDGQGFSIAIALEAASGNLGLFQQVSGAISKLHVTGTVTSSSALAVYVGGIAVTLGGGTVTNCRSDVAITMAAGLATAGGIVENGTVTDCLFTGTITGGAEYYGVAAGVITTSYYDKTVLAGAQDEAADGLTTAVLKNGTLPAGFDPATWYAVSGSYPRLMCDTVTLTTSAGTGGTVLPATDSYDVTETVSVTATPSGGYRFSAWTGTAVTAGKVADPHDPTTTVTTDASYTLVGNFEPVPADASVNIEEALYTILTSDSTVAASVSTRVFMGFLPQGKDLPAITWTMIADIPEYHAMGMCGLSKASFQIDCWAATFGACRTLQKAVINALTGYHATVDGLVVQSILITDIADSSTYPAEAEVRKTYGKRIDIDIFYENNLGV